MGSNKVSLGVNDLETWCIENNKENILNEWDYSRNEEASPDTTAYASNKKIWWRCPNGHSYHSRVGNRVFRGDANTKRAVNLRNSVKLKSAKQIFTCSVGFLILR